MKYIIEVIRRRSSVTQGSALVLVNGVEVADFYDEIKLLKKGEHYYGENIGGWASVTPDESFIKGMLFHPFEELFRYFGNILKQARVIPYRTFSKAHHMRTAPERRPRLIECDMPIASEPQKLNVSW